MTDTPQRESTDIFNENAMVRAEAFYRIMACHPGEYGHWFELLNQEARDGAYGISAGAAALIAIDVNLAHRSRNEAR